ncbi:MAG: ABC transporter permease [Burkholderiaceae bacterium]
MNTPAPGLFSLIAASGLVLVNAALSLAMTLGMARSLLVAATRMVVQLLLVGLVLKSVFASDSLLLIGIVLVTMFGTASYEVLSRQEHRFVGLWRYGLGAGTTLIATLLVAAFALVTLRPSPWYEPQFLIPLVGIVLGSVMNGVSISLNAFSIGLMRERTAIEAQLALGASRYVALKPLQRSALRSGLIPIVNQMSAAGIITLPGLMTGQILAGLPPLAAARYQILILLLLAGATGLGAVATTTLAVWRATDDRDRLRLDRLDAG